jgi:hypothetical protein
MRPEVRDALERYRFAGAHAAALLVAKVVGLFFFLFVGAIFSTIGGVIGQAIFQRKLPPGTIDVTPPPPAA